jgi:hypothetical protein
VPRERITVAKNPARIAPMRRRIRADCVSLIPVFFFSPNARCVYDFLPDPPSRFFSTLNRQSLQRAKVKLSRPAPQISLASEAFRL